MEIELKSGAGIIRLSDDGATIGPVELDDVLASLLGALGRIAHVSDDEEIVLSKGDFGFQPRSAD